MLWEGPYCVIPRYLSAFKIIVIRIELQAPCLRVVVFQTESISPVTPWYTSDAPSKGGQLGDLNEFTRENWQLLGFRTIIGAV